MLSPHLLHLYGPLWINSYGLMIVLGLVVFMWLSFRNPLRIKYIPENVYSNALLIGIVSGVVGGRLLYGITEYPWQTESLWPLLYPWEPGLSLLGAVIAIPLSVGSYLLYHRISALLFLDIAALYAPLLQAIARFGCLFAGCCYGLPAHGTHWWTVIYTDADSLAPFNIPLHPTQLYSALASFCIFIILHIFSRRFLQTRGMTFGWYLILEGGARYLVDLWRAKTAQETLSIVSWGPISFTYYQALALTVSCVGLIIVISGLWQQTRTN